MTLSFPVFPSGDESNDGWTIVAATYTKIYEVLRAFKDDCHIRCPSYRGGAEVSFPTDVTDLPDGAIIDSVSILIRLKSNSGSGPRSVTVNVLSSDNRSRYTTRTIYATSTIQTKTVATYTKDPLGLAWDVSRLNKLRCRLFSYNNLFDSVRLYGLELQVNYHVKPSVTITSPTGTVTTPSPVISWTYQQQEGEPQKSAEYKIFTLTDASASTFDPNTAAPVFQATVDGESNSFTLPTALNGDDYMIYVRAKSQFGCTSSWANKQFTVNAPSPGVPGDNNAGISGVPGIGIPTVVPDNFTSSAAIRMQDTSNLLSVQQADFEIASDPLGYGGSNCTLARDTLHAFGDGVASMKLTATSAATINATANRFEIAENQPLTLRCQFLAGATGRTVNVYALFYDSELTQLGSFMTASGTDASDTWTEVVATGTSPAGTQYVHVVLEVVGAANGEVHYVDHVGLMYGTNTAWSDGGHTSRNMLTSFLATGDDPQSAVDSWVSANAASTTQIVAATGTGSNGAKTNQMSYIGVSPSIGFRAAGSVFTTPTAGTNFTLNKPAGLADNDLMIAFVTSTESGTISPPDGWTTVNTASIDDASTDTSLWILKRTGLASDPATWTTGTVSTSSNRRTAVVVAYSGAAHSDDQFIADAVATSSDSNTFIQTAQVFNTDANAWRVCAFASNEATSGGSFTANTSAPSAAPPISYVGKATRWYTTSDTNSYTINKPANVVSGDLMVAAVSFSGNVTSVTPPSGWTLVRRTHISAGDGTAHSGDLTTAIFKRTAGASEPNSWSSTHTDWGQPKISQAVAYRNCDLASSQFVAEDVNTDTNRSSITTATINNTNSKAWRLCLFASTTAFGDSWSGGDVSERTDDSTNASGFPDCTMQFSDSNGPVGTGNTSRSARLDDDSAWSVLGWIAMLKPLSSAPSPGANETERVDNDNGSTTPWLATAVYDSNGVIPAGNTSVYGQSAGATINSMASWIGIIKPAASTAGGTVAAHTSSMIDIGSLNPLALALARQKVTMVSSFLGSSAGTPTLTLQFYRANQLIGSESAAGQAFNASAWTKSWGVFDIPEGTTRIQPVVSALGRSVGDTVQFDKIGVLLGALADPSQEPAWQPGTSRAEHPVWSTPIIEYQENNGNGYGDWKPLLGQSIQPPQYDLATGQMFYVDHTIAPLNSRRYRVATISFGLKGDTFSSGFGPASSEVIFEPNSWWLKDLQNFDNSMQISVKWKDMDVTTANTAQLFQPLGNDFPIVVTDGVKSDSVEIEIHCEQAEFPQLMDLLKSGRTLILQSDIDKTWWVRPVGDIQNSILATSQRQSRPRRYVKVTFQEVAPLS
jgi:hypothetical protein